MKKIDIRAKIFFSVWLVYLLFIYVKPESMSGQLVDLAMSIVDKGNVYLRYSSHVDASFYKGHYLSGFLPGASLILIPIYFIFKPVLSSFADPVRFVATHVLSVVFISSVAGALLTVIFYSFLKRLVVSTRSSLILSFFFAFGTMNFGSSIYFSKDLLATLYVFSAFFILFCARLENKRGWKAFFWTGFLLMAGIVTNPASLCAGLIIFMYGIYVGGVKKLPAMIAGTLIPIAMFFVYSKVAFGSFFADPYEYRIKSGNIFVMPRWQNFIRLFFSPREGFFTYMPVMILSLWGIVEALRKGWYRAEIITVTSIFVLAGLIFSGYVRGHDPLEVVGSHDTSFVIRYLLILCPFMMVPVGFVVEKVRRAVLYFLGGVSIIFSYLATQAGLLPYSGGWPPFYAFKVFVSSFGMPTLFSESLPNWFGVVIFHTYVSRSDISIGQLLSPQNRSLLFLLVRNQLFFCALFMMVAVFVVFIIWRLWQNCEAAVKESRLI